MARPAKVGLDYFELDCHMDEKVELIEAEFGLKGFAVIVKLYQSIYSGFGYYCEWTPEISVLWAYRLGCSHSVDLRNVGSVCDECALPGFPKNLINEIVAASIRRNIFSAELFNKYRILTSSGIQKRYLNAVSRREKVELKKEYLLISVGKNNQNVVINSVFDSRNSKNVDDNPQSKKEKSREEKNSLGRFVPPSASEVDFYCLERGNGISGQEFVDFYQSKGWMVGKNKMKDWKAAVRTWERKRGFKPEIKPKAKEVEPQEEELVGDNW